jgi:hypothetical protein
LRFIQAASFTREWGKLGLTEEDLMALEMLIMASPEGPPVVPGTGGLRKVRFAPAKWGTGKRGAARVLYAFFQDHSVVVFISIYDKSQKDDFDHGTKGKIKELLEWFKKGLEKETKRRPTRPHPEA